MNSLVKCLFLVFVQFFSTDAYPLGMYYGRPGGSFQTLSMFNPMTALGGMQPSLNALKPFALQPAVKPSSKLNREALSPRTFVPKEPLDSYDKKLRKLNMKINHKNITVNQEILEKLKAPETEEQQIVNKTEELEQVTEPIKSSSITWNLFIDSDLIQKVLTESIKQGKIQAEEEEDDDDINEDYSGLLEEDAEAY